MIEQETYTSYYYQVSVASQDQKDTLNVASSP